MCHVPEGISPCGCICNCQDLLTPSDEILLLENKKKNLQIMIDAIDRKISSRTARPTP
jgi:hypothetical protein